MKVKEYQLLDAIEETLRTMDADDLARVAGEVIGGECFFSEGEYEFEPNDNYAGTLGNDLYPVDDEVEEEDDELNY